MAAPSPETEPLQLGAVIKATFGAIRRNPIALLVLSGVFIGGHAVVMRSHVWIGLPYSPVNQLLMGLYDMGADLVPYALLYAGASHVVAAEMEGRRSGMAIAAATVATFPRVLATYALYSGAVLIGLVLLVVPGVMVGIAWEVAPTAAALKDGWGVASLRRSASLTRGRRGTIFGINFVVGFVAVLLFLIAYFAFIAAGGDFRTYSWATVIFASATIGLSQTFSAVMSAVIYFELRRIKEGALHERLSEVFG
jgi:hypothetical protein